MKNRRWMMGVLALFPAVALAVAVSAAWRPAAVRAADEPGGGTAALEGKAAPDFSLDTLDGKNLKLSDLRGSVVLVDFWATWCGPCKKSLPHVQELSADKARADKGLKVVAVDVQEEKDRVQTYIKNNSFTFAVALDKEGKASEAYKIEGIPATIIVGRDGTVKKVLIGLRPEKEVNDAVDAALAEKAKTAKAE